MAAPVHNVATAHEHRQRITGALSALYEERAERSLALKYALASGDRARIADCRAEIARLDERARALTDDLTTLSVSRR